MNALIDKYGTEKFDILGFPCDQFLLQEPGRTDREIMRGIKYVRPGGGFVSKITIFQKILVNGNDRHPLYEWLQELCPSPQIWFDPVENLFYDDYHIDDIRWNWEKILLDHEGKPFKRYNYDFLPEDIMPDIEMLLAKMDRA